MKFSISFIVPLVYRWNQCSVGTGAVGHAATGGGVLGGIYENNVIILLCGNIVKYIAISEILNSSYYPTCIPLKSMFRPDGCHWTCCHWWRALRGIYQHNPIILLYGNIVKYIAIGEILNCIYCSTCIPLKSIFRWDRRRCTCFHRCRGTRRHLRK